MARQGEAPAIRARGSTFAEAVPCRAVEVAGARIEGDLRQNLPDGAMVVLGKVNLDPRQSTRPDRMKGSGFREFRERPGRPVLHAALSDQSIHDVDEAAAPAGPNFTIPRFSPSASAGSIVL